MANYSEVLKELQQQRNRLDQAIRVIAKLIARDGTRLSTASARKPRRTVSAAARRKMAAAQRARWAKAKGAKASPTVRTMSQAARKKIAVAQRARWAKVRAQQKKAA